MFETKFRAWNKKDRLMGHVLSINFTIKDLVVDVEPYLHNWNFDDVELMQFTNFKDYNKVDIYQGDIVKTISCDEYPDETGLFIVKFYSSTGGFCLAKDNERHGLPLSWGGYKKIEIIGNIYQHPDLLEG